MSAAELARLYDQQVPALFRFLMALTHHEADTRDLLQKAFLRTARPPVWPGFMRPVQIGLAAAWACIGVMRLTMPPGPEPLPLAESGQQPVVFPRPLPGGELPADFDLAWVQP